MAFSSLIFVLVFVSFSRTAIEANSNISTTTPSEVKDKEPVKRNILSLSVPDFNEDELNYKFLYRAWEDLDGRRYGEDTSKHHRFHHREQRIDGNTKGQYRFELPSGKIQVVSYKQNGEEYLAKVNYLPTENKLNPCLGLEKDCTSGDAEVQLENFDLDYDYTEFEGKYGKPVHASERLNSDISHVKNNERQSTDSSKNLKLDELKQKGSKKDTDNRKQNRISLYQNIKSDSGVMYGINNQVVVGSSYGSHFPTNDYGGLEYAAPDKASSVLKNIKRKPYFDPVASVVPLKPITGPFISQSNPNFYISSKDDKENIDFYPISNSAYYFHDDIPSYSTNIMPQSNRLIHTNYWAPKQNSANSDKIYIPLMQKYFPTEFKINDKNRPTSVENLHSKVFNKHLHDNNILSFQMRPIFQPVLKDKFRGTTPTTYKPSYFSKNFIKSDRHTSLPLVNNIHAYSKPSGKVFHPQGREAIMSQVDDGFIYRMFAPHLVSTDRVMTAHPHFPPIYRDLSLNSKQSSRKQRLFAGRMLDENPVPDSILSSFSALSPPSYKTGLRMNYITTAQPLKFTIKDAVFRNIKRDTQTQNFSRPLPDSTSSASEISKYQFRPIKTTTDASSSFRKKRLGGTISDADRFRYLDSGDAETNSMILSLLYKGPQFAPSDFSSVKIDSNRDINIGKSNNQFQNSEPHFPRDDVTERFKSSSIPDFHSQKPLPQYPPLGNPQFQTSIIRFPDSEIIPISQQDNFPDKLSSRDGVGVMEDFAATSISRRNYRTKNRLKLLGKFCPECIKKAYTQRYIYPNEHLRKAGAYIQLVDLRTHRKSQLYRPY